jgi:ArsR family transcriptional regulator
MIAGVVHATTDERVDVGVAARLFHGLSDPTRLAILLQLLDREQRVTDLVQSIRSSQSNVSNHLACLRECGLVVDRPAARRQVFYSLAHPELIDVLAATERLLAEVGHEVRLCTNPLMDDGCRDG